MNDVPCRCLLVNWTFLFPKIISFFFSPAFIYAFKMLAEKVVNFTEPSVINDLH